MSKPRALDLFCGGGGASMGLHRAGFDVVGVDIMDQPRYPFEFHKFDALKFPLKGFDFIWASPPCQAFTNAQKIRGNEHPDLVDPIRRRLKRSKTPWVIENVIGAPLRDPIMLCGAMFNLRVYRHRIFESSFYLEAPPHPEHIAPVQKMGRPPKQGYFMHVVGNFSGVAEAKLAMGIDWMARNELSESIPPAYSEYIGRKFMELSQC